MAVLTEKRRETLRWVFTGPDGIRAGWSILIFIAVFFASIALVGAIIHLFHKAPPHPSGEQSQIGLLITEGIATLLLLFAMAVMGRIEKKPFWSYGLAMRDAFTHVRWGLFFGFSLLSLLVGALYAGGWLAFDGAALHGTAILTNGVVLGIGFFLVGVSEELTFRGYILSAMTRGIGFWPGAVVSSLIFAAAHTGNGGESVVGILQVFVAGMLLSALLRVTGSLWLSIGWHAAWDWAQSFFYGTADSGQMFKGHFLISHAVGNAQLSGGATGPEGSLIATPILIGGLALMVLIYRGRGTPTALAAA